jgi:rhodanese-related sulfurtransferase
MIETITRDELRQKMDAGEDFLLVETLGRPAFEHQHLPGALNLPPDRIAELAPELLPDKNAEIIVYCSKPS